MGAFGRLGSASAEKPTKAALLRAIENVAEKLGNTPAICRKCYVHPAVLEAYLGGTLDRIVRRASERRRATGLDADERAVLPLLRTCARREKRGAGRASRRSAPSAPASG